jgi:hypothetical protein
MLQLLFGRNALTDEYTRLMSDSGFETEEGAKRFAQDLHSELLAIQPPTKPAPKPVIPQVSIQVHFREKAPGIRSFSYDNGRRTDDVKELIVDTLSLLTDQEIALIETIAVSTDTK